MDKNFPTSRATLTSKFVGLDNIMGRVCMDTGD